MEDAPDADRRRPLNDVSTSASECASFCVSLPFVGPRRRRRRRRRFGRGRRGRGVRHEGLAAAPAGVATLVDYLRLSRPGRSGASGFRRLR